MKFEVITCFVFGIAINTCLVKSEQLKICPKFELNGNVLLPQSFDIEVKNLTENNTDYISDMIENVFLGLCT